jgi:hypothetical protein
LSFSSKKYFFKSGVASESRTAYPTAMVSYSYPRNGACGAAIAAGMLLKQLGPVNTVAHLPRTPNVLRIVLVGWALRNGAVQVVVAVTMLTVLSLYSMVFANERSLFDYESHQTL